MHKYMYAFLPLIHTSTYVHIIIFHACIGKLYIYNTLLQCNSSVISTLSDMYTFLVNCEPYPVSELSFVSTETSVTLMWNEPAPRFSAVCAYGIMYKFGRTQSLAHTKERVFLLTDIPPKTLVTFAVEAISCCGFRSLQRYIKARTSEFVTCMYNTMELLQLLCFS